MNSSDPVEAPFHFVVYEHEGLTIYEVRPRTGTWAPFLAAVPIRESAAVDLRLTHGPAGKARLDGVLFESGSGTNDAWAFRFAANVATPTMSYYAICRTPPSALQFGPKNGQQFFVRPKASRPAT